MAAMRTYSKSRLVFLLQAMWICELADGKVDYKDDSKACDAWYPKPVENICADNFPAETSGDLWIMLFSSHDCSHCKVIEKKFLNMAKKLQKDPTIRVGVVNCYFLKNYRSLCYPRHKVNALPTLRIIEKGKFDVYNGPRQTWEDIDRLVKAKLDAREPCPDKIPGIGNTLVTPLCKRRFPGKDTVTTWIILYVKKKDAASIIRAAHQSSMELGNSQASGGSTEWTTMKKRDRLDAIKNKYGFSLNLRPQGPFGIEPLVQHVGAICCDCSAGSDYFCKGSLSAYTGSLPAIAWFEKGALREIQSIAKTRKETGEAIMEYAITQLGYMPGSINQVGEFSKHEGGFLASAKASEQEVDTEDMRNSSQEVAPADSHLCRRFTAADMTTEELEAELAMRRAAELPPSDRGSCTRIEGRPPAGAMAERVVIIGGGPAGLSAAVYAARSGLCPVVIAPELGGQLMLKGVDVENYPGLPRAGGHSMVTDMRRQAESFFAELRNDIVVAVDLTRHPFEVRANTSGLIRTETMIIATGSDSRWLGVPGEDKLRGHGVTSCATCDGYMYPGKRCAVVGGGDSALEDALMLSRLCSSVRIIHRRGEFRAGRILRDRVHERGIEVLWNSEVVEFIEDNASLRLAQVTLRNSQTLKITRLELDAVFIAIGHFPNTDLFKDQLDMLGGDAGYLVTEGKSTRTSVPGVFAAGDVTDPIYRQAVTSAGSGAQAALDAERWLSERPMDASRGSAEKTSDVSDLDEEIV